MMEDRGRNLEVGSRNAEVGIIEFRIADGAFR